jgi:hypothetical protein
MVSKNLPPNPNQAAFFDYTVVGNGQTDPGGHNTRVVFGEPTLDGIYGEPPVEVEYVGIENVHNAVMTERNRRAQTGKHSPLQRDGTYSTVKAGDVLPGFGIVTHMNLPAAQVKADALERERRASK